MKKDTNSFHGNSVNNYGNNSECSSNSYYVASIPWFPLKGNN